jgi:hypothetical protein
MMMIMMMMMMMSTTDSPGFLAGRGGEVFLRGGGPGEGGGLAGGGPQCGRRGGDPPAEGKADVTWGARGGRVALMRWF